MRKSSRIKCILIFVWAIISCRFACHGIEFCFLLIYVCAGGLLHRIMRKVCWNIFVCACHWETSIYMHILLHWYDLQMKSFLNSNDCLQLKFQHSVTLKSYKIYFSCVCGSIYWNQTGWNWSGLRKINRIKRITVVVSIKN